MRILFLLYFFLQGIFVTAQPGADSIRRVLESGISYPEKMKVLIQFTGNYAQAGHNKELIALCRNGLELANEKKDSLSIAILTRNMSNAWYFLGNYDSAANGYYQSAAILDKSKWQTEMAETCNNLGRLYRKTRDLDRSLNYYNRAMSIYQELGDKPGIAKILNESGVVFEYRGDFDEAIRRYEQSLRIDESLKDSIGISYAYNFLAGVYTLKKDYRKAEEYMAKVVTLRKQLKDTFGLSLAYTDLGATLLAKGDYMAATGYLLESNRVAEQMDYKELMMNNYGELSAIAEKQGNHKDAYEYLQKKTALRDSLFNIEKTKQIEALNARYETAVKEQIIQKQYYRLTRQRWLIGGILGLLVLGSLLAYSQYKRSRLKKEKQHQEEIFMQQEQAAKSVIAAEENERKRIASELHDGVGQMMSAARMNLSAFENTLQFSGTEQQSAFDKIIGLVDDSAKEVRNVSHNLMPFSVQQKGLVAAVTEFTGKINREVIEIGLYTEDTNGEPADPATATILYRVIQECVNNVLKHAHATRMDISMACEENNFAVTIEDNGHGFDTAALNGTAGLGLENIKSRVAYLRGTVEFDSAPGRGTVVVIHIPLYKEKL
jgi:two-component system, NarL family, sensor kinase